jgi:xanthine dehydrogenase large subunit
MLEDEPNREDSIYRSKAVGEPPLMLAISVFQAIRDAIAATGPPGSLPHLDAPATPQSVLGAIEKIGAARGLIALDIGCAP